MAAKAILILCAQALLAQFAFSQSCAGGIATPYGIGRAGLAYDGLATDRAYNSAYGAGYGAYGAGCSTVAPLAGVAPASGGGLPISSASPIPVSGLSVASENAIEGILAVTGNLPFLSAVALEGVLPTAGVGSVLYGCGDGSIGMVSASAEPTLGLTDRLGFGAGLATPYGGLGAPALGLGVPALGLGAPTRGLAANNGCGCGAVY